jgi:uncharacterized OsmC-like protein
MAGMTSYSAVSRSTDTPGRTITTARHNHFIIDSPSGPNEALLTGEAFLAGIAACGVTLVQGRAKSVGVALGPMTVSIEGFRSDDKPADFHHIDVKFEYRQTAEADARMLTDLWTQQ